MASGGQEALELIKKKNECENCKNMFRMLFVDINMPGINGIELVKILKEL